MLRCRNEHGLTIYSCAAVMADCGEALLHRHTVPALHTSSALTQVQPTQHSTLIARIRRTHWHKPNSGQQDSEALHRPEFESPSTHATNIEQP